MEDGGWSDDSPSGPGVSGGCFKEDGQMEDGGFSHGRWSDDLQENDQMIFHVAIHYVQDKHGAPPLPPVEDCLKEVASRRLP